MPSNTGTDRSVRRFRSLLVSLLLLIGVEPFARGPAARILLVGLFSVILLSAIRGLQAHRRAFLVGAGLAVPAILGSWIGVFVQSLTLFFVSRALTVAFLAVVVVTLLADIAGQTRIHPETIYQAACVYLTLGIIFALFYSVIDMADPTAFAPVVTPGAAPSDPGAQAATPALARWVYFSFITLTTVGYGDITPIAPAARSLVILEALLGQFFVAVLVARLVGLLQAQLSGE